MSHTVLMINYDNTIATKEKNVKYVCKIFFTDLKIQQNIEI